MHLPAFDQSSWEEYMRTGILPHNIRPSHCKRCEERHSFHRHSRYQRKCVFRSGGWLTPFYIQRFKCAACAKVFSLLPDFLYKWQRLDLELTQKLLSQAERVRTLLQEHFSKRTIQRLRARWLERVEAYRPKISQILLFLKSDLDIDVPQEKLTSTWQYLKDLWEGLPKEMPLLLFIVSILQFGGRLQDVLPT